MSTRAHYIYLISDSTGETVSIVARSVYARFENTKFVENKWALIRTEKQINNITEIIKIKPGLVLYTMINKKLENYLKAQCSKIGVNTHPILNNTITAIEHSFNINTKAQQIPGKQHSLTDDYFDRIEALQYAIVNDDGQKTDDFEKADIILFGVSRTSKTPTSIYLANKGIKVANIPYVLNQDYDFTNIGKNTLVIGLFASVERLQQIRISRLNTMNEKNKTSYIDIDSLKLEIAEARKICSKNKWSTIDVTKKSIEEVAATALEYLKIFRNKN